MDMEGEEAGRQGWRRGDVGEFLEQGAGGNVGGDERGKDGDENGTADRNIREEKGLRYEFCVYERQRDYAKS